MRSLPVLLAAALLSVGAGACGSAARRIEAARRAGAAAGGVSARAVPSAGEPGGPRTRWGEPAYLNDGDRESPLDPDKDHREDEDSDSRFHENTRYRDADDSGVVTYGHAADTADTRRVRVLVKRYYAAAGAGDGAAACALLTPRLAAAAPVDYGQAGPSHPRGEETCGVVAARLFESARSDLSAPVEVTDVRVSGEEGLALVGSRTRPPTYIVVQREHGAWGVGQLLPQRMP